MPMKRDTTVVSLVERPRWYHVSSALTVSSATIQQISK